MVRRFRGLWRVCPSFSPFVLVFVLLSLSLCACCALLVLLSVLFVLVSLWVLCFLFPLRTNRQKERAQFLASSLVLLCVVVMRLLIARGLPAIPFQPLRELVRNCSNVGGSRQNKGNLMR